MSRLFNFNSVVDNRGELTFFEIGKDKNIPFEVKRIYYLYNSNSLPRGFHAHKDLSQVLILLNGSARIILDDGKVREEIIMENPKQGLLIESMYWREIHDISQDAIILVLASNYYDEEDYIRSYDEFLQQINK